MSTSLPLYLIFNFLDKILFYIAHPHDYDSMF